MALWQSDEHERVWIPEFSFAGTTTSWHRQERLEQVVKGSVVRRFAEEAWASMKAALTDALTLAHKSPFPNVPVNDLA